MSQVFEQLAADEPLVTDTYRRGVHRVKNDRYVYDEATEALRHMSRRRQQLAQSWAASRWLQLDDADGLALGQVSPTPAACLRRTSAKGCARQAIRAALESAYWRAVAEATHPYHGQTTAPSLPFCVDGSGTQLGKGVLDEDRECSAVLVLLPHLSDWAEDAAVCAAARECLIDALCPTLPTLPTDEQVTSTPQDAIGPLRSLPACRMIWVH